MDLPERLEVVVEDTRRVVRCPHCGFRTARVHDRRRVRVRDLTFGGRTTTLVWLRRRLACDSCGPRFLEDHPEFLIGRVTHITRRLGRTLVRDVNRLSIRELSRHWDLGWHPIMGLVASWSSLVVGDRRRRRCRVLMVDETSLRRRHRYVTVLINGETGEGLGVIKHRNSQALSGFLASQGHRWCRQVKVVVTDGSEAYRTAIRQHLGHATHVVDRFHVARWFASALIEVRRQIQRIGPHGSRPAYNPDIFRSRYLQLRRADRLDPEGRERLERVLSEHPELAHAWTLYQHLHRIYIAAGDDDANQALGEFIAAYQDRSLPEFEQVIGALIDWGDEIFAFHDADRVTNGRLEGTNAKLGVLKRAAYGFVSATNFGHRALLLCPGVAT
ncbi:MAG: ISL3 family transposase [Acidimicrobiia bacterium]|nr:MAG: ISL3 family transposase [Acidimicrobiia bacterium]